ncbi:MAG: 6-carboxytetrahydropterin synthase QueD [Phycisphaerae bacterium]|nr:6-carboxytetrahydropterin synthase QueD [Phycisphaerae bacterium]
MRVSLRKSFGFEAAHWLPTFPDDHKCHRLHGHSFHIDVVVEGDVPEEQGYLVDFAVIKAAIKPVEEALDHRCLNDIEGLENPTSEMLARWIWDRLAPELPMLSEIHVHETCTSSCIYRGT